MFKKCILYIQNLRKNPNDTLPKHHQNTMDDSDGCY